ncbi:MAG: hypothetical protein M3Q96_04535 [Pseudomonadota bacterium]|nr:hypothetical protein [Pseudomonadota bacterium]
MREELEVGQMVFVADGEVGVGAVREVRESELVVNIQNTGDVVLPLTAIRDVHSGKVLLDLDQLEAPVIEALNRVHDAEYREFAALDPTDGTPDGVEQDQAT